jgi:uncharacterized protein
MAAPHAPVARPKPKAEEGMKRSISIIAVLGLALAPIMTVAQPPASQQPAAAAQQDATEIPADQQATPEQIAKLFEVMRLREQLNRTLAMLPEMMKRGVRGQMKEILQKYPQAQQMTPEQKTALEKLMEKYMQQAADIYPTDEMIRDATTVYEHHITRADADAYIAFYSTPAGQRLIDAQPQIMREYMGVVMGRMRESGLKLAGAMQQDVQQMMQSQTPASAAPAAPKN